jgi:hypothetical protein
MIFDHIDVFDVEDETAAILSEQLHEQRVHGAGCFAGADRAENDDVLRGVRDREGDLVLRRDAGGCIPKTPATRIRRKSTLTDGTILRIRNSAGALPSRP